MKSQTENGYLPPAGVMKAIEHLRNALYRFRMHLVPNGVALFELVHDFWYAKAVGVAIELNIAVHLEKQPLPIDELAKRTHTHAPSLYRLMRTLASRGVFKEKKNKVFCLTSLAKALLDGDGGMKYMVQSHVSNIQLKNFGELLHCVRTGENAFKKIYGNETFDFLVANPREAEIFNKGMSNASALFAKALLSAYSFKKSRHIIDIGGGNGNLLLAILQKYSHCTATLFDLPQVIEPLLLRNAAISNERIKLDAGDFFNQMPDGADTYILKNVLHDWDDDRCHILLNNIRKVMPEDASLLIIESLVPEGNTPGFAKMMDLLMLVGSTGGKERTLDEYKMLLQGSDLRLKKVVYTVAPFSVMVATAGGEKAKT